MQSDAATCFKRKIHPPLRGETVRTGLQTGQALNLFQCIVLNSGQRTKFFYLQAELQKELLELKGHEEAAREQDIMRKKAPKKPASHPLTIRSFILSSTSAWCSPICQSRHSKERHTRELGKGTDLVCNKKHSAKSHLEIHRSCIVFLGNHILQLLLQVLLSRVLDINVVTLWAGKVAADALCEESGHHSLSHPLPTTAGRKPHAFQIVDTSLLPYRSCQQIPSSFPSTLESIPSGKYSCCWRVPLPPLLPLSPSAWAVLPDLRISVPRVGIGRVRAGADLCAL